MSLPTYQDLHGSDTYKVDPLADEKHPVPPPPELEGSSAGPSTVPYSASPSSLAVITLSRSDRIRLFRFPETVNVAVGSALKATWEVKQLDRYHEGWEWKLSGTPWHSSWKTQNIKVRRMLSALIDALYTQGWHLMITCDLAAKEYDKDVLFFRPGPAVKRHVFAVQFVGGDRFRMIDYPPAAVRPLAAAVRLAWPRGIQKEEDMGDGVYQLKLKDYPFNGYGDSSYLVKLLVADFIIAAETQGYELVASFDMTPGYHESGYDIDTLYFASK